MWGNLVYQRGPMGMNGWSDIQILLLVVLFLLILIIIYFIFFPKLERVSTSTTIKKEVEDTQEENRSLDVALKLLEPDERKVVEVIVEAGGSMLQKDISFKLEMSRVKTHRTLVKLIRRGIVTAKKQFNTNLITLADWLKN